MFNKNNFLSNIPILNKRRAIIEVKILYVGKIQNDNHYQQLVDTIYRENDYDFVGIALQQDRSPHLTRWCYVAGNQNERYRKIILRRGIGIAGMVLRTGKPFLNNQLKEYAYSNSMYTPIAHVEALESAIAIPIVTGHLMMTHGVLLAGYRSPSKCFSSTDILHLSQYLN